MTKTFRKRVCLERIVDTGKYRYILVELPGRAEIRRLSVGLLDTVAACNSWELVEVLPG